MKFPQQHTVFRNKAALRVSPMRAQWELGSNGHYSVAKTGSFFIEIAPAKGRLAYDWDKKVVIALNPLEMVSMFPALKTEAGFKAIHDPGAGSVNKGKVVKTMSAKAVGNGGIGITINVKKGEASEFQNIVVSGPDLLLLKILSESVIPSLYGWPEALDVEFVKQHDLSGKPAATPPATSFEEPKI